MRNDHEVGADIGKIRGQVRLNFVLPRLNFHLLYTRGVVEETRKVPLYFIKSDLTSFILIRKWFEPRSNIP